jgi:hypothetical protein
MKTNPIQKLIVIVTILLGINYSNAQQTIWQGCTTATYSVEPSPDGLSTYAWSVTTSSGTPVIVNPLGSSRSISIDWTGVPASTDPYTVSVTETSSNGCTGTPQVLPVTIIATPTAAARVTADPTCSVATATIEVSAPTGAGYEYGIFVGNGPVRWYPSPTIIVQAGAAYNVIVKSQTGCLSIATPTPVNVIPQPVGPTTSPITFN